MPVQDATRRFSSRVENYVRYRPGYPPEILDVLKRDCDLRPGSVIADVGSGTGLLSRVLLENGNRVIGIEPNKEMREAGERLLRDFPNFTSIEARAEATTLPDHSADFVIAGQAAHWFDRVRSRQEFIRISRTGGWTVFVWNDRSTESTTLLRAYEELLVKYGTDYHEVQRAGFETATDIASFFKPNKMLQHQFPNHQDFDFNGFKGRLLSSSYTPAPGHPNHKPMLAELRRLFDAYNVAGKVRFEYETRMYYGQLA
jgi:SAM-dependent methyltransferase